MGRPTPGGLAGQLGEGLLVVDRVGHGEGESVDELGSPAVPEPLVGGLGIELLRRLADEVPQGVEVELGAGAAIVAGVAGGDGSAGQFVVVGDIGDGLGAGGALAVAKCLGEEGPEDDGRGEDRVGGKEPVALSEGVLDGLGGQDVGERQAGLMKEGGQRVAEGGLAGRRRGVYSSHRKDPPWLLWDQKPRRATENHRPRRAEIIIESKKVRGKAENVS